jgi:hypothetical protein
VSHSPERRASPRCDAVENQSRLMFAEPYGGRRIAARLVNISRRGALIVTETPPPYEVPIWLRIEIPVKTDWVEAMIVRRGKNRDIAFQFPGGCRDDLFLAGAIGIDLTSMISDGGKVASSCD